MNKTKGYIIVGIATSVFMLPLIVIGYGFIFGHTFSGNQVSAAGLMACGGVFVGLVGSMIVDLSK